MVLHRAQLHAAHAADARVITAGDYAVLVQGLPAPLADAELRDWCSHYGSGGLANFDCCFPTNWQWWRWWGLGG
jgi:hypothetical protein